MICIVLYYIMHQSRRRVAMYPSVRREQPILLIWNQRGLRVARCGYWELRLHPLERKKVLLASELCPDTKAADDSWTMFVAGFFALHQSRKDSHQGARTGKHRRLLRDLDKGYSLLIKDANEKYMHMGRLFAPFYIRTVGETTDEIKHHENSSREVLCMAHTPNL